MGLSLPLPASFTSCCSCSRSGCLRAARDCSIRVDGGGEEWNIETRRMSFRQTRVEIGDVSATKLMDALFEIAQAGDNLCAG